MRIITTVFLAIFSLASASALSSSQVTITNGSGPYFYADDGNCGSSEVPRAAYLVVNVENTSSTDTLFNIQVKLTSISNTAAGFKLLSFSTDSTYNIPVILPDSTIGSYFYVQYPCTKNLTSAFNFSLSDGNSGVVTFSTNVSTEDIGPAGAGGDIISQNIAGIDALGILVADTVTYEFGNYNGGEMFFQPSGDTLFPTNNLELIGSKVLSSAFSACGPKPGDQNTLYYNSASGCGGGSGNEVKIVYYYISSLLNDTAVFKPYSGMKSGGPIKYLSNYGTGVAKDTFGTTLNANRFTMTKTASCGICTPGDTITYTITIANSASVDLMFDKLLDSLPAGHSFVEFATGSDINKTNTSSYPSVGATSNMTFSGMIPTSTFPYRSYLVPASGSIQLQYKVKIPGSSSSTVFTNQAIGMVGNNRIDTANAQTCAGCSALPVTLLYFRGHVVGEVVEIEWATAQERDNVGFDVYRYNEPEDQIWIDFVPGNGHSDVVSRYETTDNYYLGSKTQVYRLHQSDLDGNGEDYFTAVAGNQFHKNTLVVSPNPVSESTRVLWSNEFEYAKVSVWSAVGRIELSTTLMRDTELNLNGLAQGIYTLLLETPDGKGQYVRILKE